MVEHLRNHPYGGATKDVMFEEVVGISETIFILSRCELITSLKPRLKG